MNKIRIAAVSYINTYPLLEGLRISSLAGEIEIIPAIPSKCAEMLLMNQVDISLCPVAALKEMDHYQILSDYCIGCDGPVRTVSLYSNCHLNEIERVYLDPASRTSNQLVQILAGEYWKKDWNFIRSIEGSPKTINQNEAVLAIGDKAFDYERQFRNHWDLGTAWKDFIDLPFTFAVWASKDPISLQLEQRMNDAFESGVKLIPDLELEDSRYRDYLLKNISYHLDHKKREALDIFLNRLNFTYSQV